MSCVKITRKWKFCSAASCIWEQHFRAVSWGKMAQNQCCRLRYLLHSMAGNPWYELHHSFCEKKKFWFICEFQNIQFWFQILDANLKELKRIFPVVSLKGRDKESVSSPKSARTVPDLGPVLWTIVKCSVWRALPSSSISSVFMLCKLQSAETSYQTFGRRFALWRFEARAKSYAGFLANVEIVYGRSLHCPWHWFR